MGMFDGPSAKRHTLWSNCQALVQRIMDRGEQMTPGKMASLKPLCRYYTDKNGVKRKVSKRDELKASQILDNQYSTYAHIIR